MTFPDGDRKLWNVVQRGDSGNDYVLTEPIPIHPSARPTISDLKADCDEPVDDGTIVGAEDAAMVFIRVLELDSDGAPTGRVIYEKKIDQQELSLSVCPKSS